MNRISHAHRRILVIGGGAAGFFAAGKAAEAGSEVTILEKMNRCGRKLNITGKGRCNLTNTAEIEEFMLHFGSQGRFLHPAFSLFFSEELIRFLNRRGVVTQKERGGRVFPEHNRAPDVTRALERWVDELGVKRMMSRKVDRINTEDGRVTGVLCSGKTFSADAVILATGGASYPSTGSTGDGYALAEELGHRIIPVRPGLVPLETGQYLGQLNGLRLKNIRVRRETDGVEDQVVFGEMAFTDTGVSGPIILTLSSSTVDLLDAGRIVQLKLDLKPALNSSKLKRRLERDFLSRGHEPVKSLLRGLIPRELVPWCLRQLKWNGNRQVRSLKDTHLMELRNWLKCITLDITGYRPFPEAIITSGGISLDEVHSGTMESKLIKNLFIAGEVLDLQADTGGYNLQAAFSTGYLAGNFAATPNS